MLLHPPPRHNHSHMLMAYTPTGLSLSMSGGALSLAFRAGHQWLRWCSDHKRSLLRGTLHPPPTSTSNPVQARTYECQHIITCRLRHQWCGTTYRWELTRRRWRGLRWSGDHKRSLLADTLPWPCLVADLLCHFVPNRNHSTFCIQKIDSVVPTLDPWLQGAHVASKVAAHSLGIDCWPPARHYIFEERIFGCRVVGDAAISTCRGRGGGDAGRGRLIEGGD